MVWADRPLTNDLEKTGAKEDVRSGRSWEVPLGLSSDLRSPAAQWQNRRRWGGNRIRQKGAAAGCSPWSRAV
jgi:hypothetical protein